MTRRQVRIKASELGHRLSNFKARYYQSDFGSGSKGKPMYYVAYCEVCDATAFAESEDNNTPNPALGRGCAK